ncbi:MAG: flagellar basal body rod C-terminal domain-containing protein, partial [Planctomycetota bacterium]|nr:flagellar basal body rod C-terminal domain-containing protein [Planctomycetota bacterium]
QRVRGLRGDLIDVRTRVDDQIRTGVERADELLHEIARLNTEISRSEQGRTEDAALRDQRDSLVTELSQLLDVSVNEQANGAIDVFADSTPLVLGQQVRGLEVRERTVNGDLVVEVVVSTNQEKISPRSGRIGALLDQRVNGVQDVVDDLDTLAANLIFEVNRLHSSGRPFPGLTDTTGVARVQAADQGVAFNDPANTTFADLPVAPRNGRFTVLVVDQASGSVTRHEIEVDLDGVDNTGAAGFGDDTSLASLTADLDALANVSATITASGQLRIQSSPGFEIGFEDDSSGVLATLGINTFFTGADATDIGIHEEVQADPQRVVAGLTEGSNEVALAITALRTERVEGLGEVSLLESWRRTTERVGVASAGSITRADAAGQVRESLSAQRAAISGVDIDEESINLLTYQRQYQASARFISTVDQLTQLLISLV